MDTEDKKRKKSDSAQDESKKPHKTISRRALLGGFGAALGAGIFGAGGYAIGSKLATDTAHAAADVLNVSYPFRGTHQSGILTPQQQQLHFAAFDVITEDKEDVIELLKNWTLAAERMQQGELVGEPKAFKEVPPTDTGETMGMPAGGLTITFGFGATFFEKDGQDRFGIADKMPAALKDGIPKMAAEKIDEDKSYGDLILQVCAEDPMIALHAVHNMTRIAFGVASLKWSQLGYGRTSSTSTSQLTPRNLFGFKDGTSNIKAEDAQSELNEHLWIQKADDKGDIWANGSYLCCRKIKMMMEVWDEIILSEQEKIIGRDKLHGAPLSGGDEFSEPDFSATDSNGNLKIPHDSHVAMMHPKNNNGRRMLRRGYNYMEGNDKLGRLEGGLFFIAYVRDPKTNFIPILEKMAGDRMTEYLQHIGSGLFICPPGVNDSDSYIGERLFS